MKLGIIGAMDIEVNALKDMMENPIIETISTVNFFCGKINGVEAVVATAGVGKVNAAVTTQTMILNYKPDLILNIGVAGGLSKDLGIGDVAVATSLVEHDMDTSPLGDEVGFISGINKVYLYCDNWLLDTVYNIAKSLGNAKKGVIASGDQFISTNEQRNKIINNFNAIAAEMEGASVGHVCEMNNVRFGVIRAISDGANDDSTMDYPTFAKIAAANSVKIVLKLIDVLKKEELS